MQDANQTCVLSKRWKYIWETFPIFDFDHYIYIKDPHEFTPECKEQARELMNFVDKSLQKFTQHKLLMYTLALNLPLVDRNYVSMVDRWLELSLDCGVQYVSLMVNTDNRIGKGIYTLPETTFVARSISCFCKLNRLQKLSLDHVHISEDVIKSIVRNCYNLKYLDLDNFEGLKTLEISKLDKLETVKIRGTCFLRDLERVNIDAPNLKHFHFNPHGLPCRISLTSCHDLKELRLYSCGITDDLLHSFLFRFSLLEVLEIANCSMLRKVKISSQQVRSLRLFPGYTEIEMIQVDAPKLSLFEYTTFDMPLLFSESVPAFMKAVYRVRYNSVANSSWFYELRESLGRLCRRKSLVLDFHQYEVNFDLEDLREREMPPSVEIDHLKLTSFNIRASTDCAALLDGVLWSCHPKTLYIPSDSTFQEDCIKVICEKLSQREHMSCCDSSYMKCWRHHLKNVKI